MPNIKIACPKCHNSYSVNESILGKLVVCSDSTCGTRFKAVEITPDDRDSHQFDQPEDEFETAPPLPAKASKTNSATRHVTPAAAITTEVKPASTFGINLSARLLLYCGLMYLFLGTLYPTSKRMDGGYHFNEILAAMKESALLVAMALTVSGTVMLCSPRATPPQLVEAVLIAMFTVFMLALLFLNTMSIARNI